MKRYILAVLAVILAACATPDVQSLDFRLAQSVATVSAARNTAATLLENGKISKESAIQVQNLGNQARILLDSAREAELMGDTHTMSVSLDAAATILNRIQLYLKGKAQ